VKFRSFIYERPEEDDSQLQEPHTKAMIPSHNRSVKIMSPEDALSESLTHVVLVVLEISEKVRLSMILHH